LIEQIKDLVAGFAVSAPFGNIKLALAALGKIGIDRFETTDYTDFTDSLKHSACRFTVGRPRENCLKLIASSVYKFFVKHLDALML
jgi:hypothetical protein